MDPVSGPRYFIENFMYIQHPMRGRQKLELYDFQLDLIDNYHANRKTVNMVSRQMGKTTVAAGYLLWYAMFVDDATILIASNKYDGAQEIMHRVRYAYESVPDHIRAGVKTYNKRSIDFDNNSRIVATTTTENTGRGMSLSLVYLD
jgi:phage terminase large subunit-like protein